MLRYIHKAYASVMLNARILLFSLSLSLVSNNIIHSSHAREIPRGCFIGRANLKQFVERALPRAKYFDIGCRGYFERDFRALAHFARLLSRTQESSLRSPTKRFNPIESNSQRICISSRAYTSAQSRKVSDILFTAVSSTVSHRLAAILAARSRRISVCPT